MSWKSIITTRNKTFCILSPYEAFCFLGWQPRWFVLSENGVLSYYYSHQDVDQGCKGSMNLGACEIVVSQNDNTRLDIVVSHEKVGLKYLFLV